MNSFKDFNIKPNVSGFTGDKIKMDRVINVAITVIDYKIEPSKQKANTNCLTLQIEKNGTRHVIFTGSKILMDMIEKVPKTAFPFLTTVSRDNEYYEFT